MPAFTDMEVFTILDERDELLQTVVRLEEKVHNLEAQEENLQRIIEGMAGRIAEQSDLLSRKAEK